MKMSVIVGLLLGFTCNVMAQGIELRGLKNNMRYNSEDEYDKYNYYVGWDSERGVAVFKTDQGVFSMDVEENAVGKPNLLYDDNLMYGNSGAIYYDGTIYTIFSHENEDGKMEFVVRTWNAETGEKLSEKIYPKSANLESAGMAYNPVDKKVYGLFYITDVPIDFDEFDENSTDAGYCVCTIDLQTMQLCNVTPGLYYDNFVTFACSPDGRLFSMTAGGTLVEFDAETGLMKGEYGTDEEGYTVFTKKYEPSGVQSQYKRQAACFDKNTGKMYWNGFVNNGMGYNEWGSYGPLPDKNWKENEKYDTALYEIDTETGKATRIGKIDNRISFSCLWVVGADNSDGATDGIAQVETSANGYVEVYNTSGQKIYSGSPQDMQLTHGLYIVKDGSKVSKVMYK